MLVLSSRFLSFLFLLLLFYQIFRSQESNGPVKYDEIYLDTSPSMYIDFESNRSIDEANSLLSSLGIAENEITSERRRLPNSSTIISDFQGITYDFLDNLVADSSFTRSFILTGDLSFYKNAFIDSMRVDFNPDDFSQLRVEVFPNVTDNLLNGNLIFRLLHKGRQLSSVVSSVKGKQKIDFDIPVSLNGNFVIQIDGDNVLYDNEFRFTVAERKKPKIVLLGAGRNVFIQNVFANENLFVTHNMSNNDLDYRLLEEADVIIIDNTSALASGVISQLENKTVVSIPAYENSDNVVLPWTGISTDQNLDSLKYEIDLGTNHPLLLGIYRKKAVLNKLPIASASCILSGDFEDILLLRNGIPFLVKSPTKPYFYFNTSFDLRQTDLPTHPLFLPLFYKIALSSTNKIDRTYYYPGDIGFMKTREKKIPPKLIAEGVERIPDFSFIEDGVSFLVPDLDPGFYQLVTPTDTMGISVNLKESESVMEGATIEGLRDRYGHLSHVNIQGTDEQELTRNDHDKRLMNYALILVIFVLVTETLFHKYIR